MPHHDLRLHVTHPLSLGLRGKRGAAHPRRVHNGKAKNSMDAHLQHVAARNEACEGVKDLADEPGRPCTLHGGDHSRAFRLQLAQPLPDQLLLDCLRNQKARCKMFKGGKEQARTALGMSRAVWDSSQTSGIQTRQRRRQHPAGCGA